MTTMDSDQDSQGEEPRVTERRRPAVMADVARLAGVSHQTVSRVINGSSRVAPATRERVQQAMRMLDYRPSSVARALVTGRSKTVGVVGFNTTLYGPATVLLGIERAAHECDYIVIRANIPELNRDSVILATERLRRQNVEGMLAVAPHTTAIQAMAQMSWHMPIVAVEAGPDDAVATVAIDQYQGAEAVTRYLLSLGHRNIFHIAGPPDWQEAQIRLRAWRETLLDAGITPPAPLYGDWTSRSGYQHGVEVAKMRDITAVFVANDQMALGVLRALDEAGRRVPEDVSVAGFDGIPESEYFTPPLTTVRQDFLEVGRQGFELVHQQIDQGERISPRLVIPAELIVRTSTGPAPQHSSAG